jgi:RNA polymerase sigma-70 factor (sigma-E family)
VTPADEREYRDFVAARLEPLRRTAYLLCRDWHTADDLVSITIGKVYRHWRRVRGADNVDAYVRGVLTHAWLDERRRPWRREEPAAEPPERGATAAPGAAAVAERLDLLTLLARLPRRQRAVVVLRFYCDLSVDETAEILGISAGTVKSSGARGLASLRLLAVHHETMGESA